MTTAIPHAAEALTSALDRFGHASMRVLGAVTGRDEAGLGAVLAEMSAAKVTARANIAAIRFSDEMTKELLKLNQRADDER